MLVNVNWTNKDARQAYVELLGPSLDAYGGVVITGSEDVRVLEGDWQPEGVLVLISFPTVRLRWRGTTPGSTARR